MGCASVCDGGWIWVFRGESIVKGEGIDARSPNEVSHQWD